MTASVDKKYRKEFDSRNYLIRSSSFKALFIVNFIFSIPLILLVLIGRLVSPFILSSKYGYSGNAPKTFSEYLSQISSLPFYLLIVLGLIIISTLIFYFRERFDNKAGYIKIGNFEVTKVKNQIGFNVVRFNNGQKLKIKNTDRDFDKFVVGQIVEVQRTASNKLLSYKIVT
ncbi:MAG TPA: hypothetical protein VHB70_08775 [Parafilimonas sp.]|nr:hypothetical protein [Parafilimonas sp.]